MDLGNQARFIKGVKAARESFLTHTRGHRNQLELLSTRVVTASNAPRSSFSDPSPSLRPRSVRPSLVLRLPPLTPSGKASSSGGHGANHAATYRPFVPDHCRHASQQNPSTEHEGSTIIMVRRTHAPPDFVWYEVSNPTVARLERPPRGE